MKVMTIVGTRPEIIRLSRVIAALDSAVDHLLVHTGQNYDYELNQIFFDDLDIRAPDQYLAAAGSTAAETIGNIIAASDRVLRDARPDAVLILGDTNSCLAAIAAKRLRIPVFHMEAGNRCFDERVPEEINRRIVDHISDINLPYSTIGREYLLREGIAPDRVIKTGSPMYEVLNHYKDRIEHSSVLERLGLSHGKYFVVSAHREENVDSPDRLTLLLDVLGDLTREFAEPIIVSTHPRTRMRLDALARSTPELVRFIKPLGFTDYVCLQRRAHGVLSDSGTITEEASILDLPAVNLREAHERPEGMEDGVVPLVGLDPTAVNTALRTILAQRSTGTWVPRIVPDYAMPNVADKVVRIILSYVPYVRRTVWRE